MEKSHMQIQGKQTSPMRYQDLVTILSNMLIRGNIRVLIPAIYQVRAYNLNSLFYNPMSVRKLINIILFVILTKHEINGVDFRTAGFLLETDGELLCSHIIFQFAHTLRPDVSIIVHPRTTSIFRNVTRRYKGCGDILSISGEKGRINIEPIYIKNLVKNDKIYFFIDEDAILYYERIKLAGLKAHFYERRLGEKTNFMKEVMINSYRKEYQISVTKYRGYIEIYLEHSHIGSIHDTLYYRQPPLLKELRSHVINFYRTVSMNTKLYKVAELYIDSLYKLLYKKSILRKPIIHNNVEGLIEILCFHFDSLMIQMNPQIQVQWLREGCALIWYLRIRRIDTCLTLQVEGRYIFSGIMRGENKLEIIFIQDVSTYNIKNIVICELIDNILPLVQGEQ